MTREEAIAHGKEQLEVFGGEHAEFIKLAIKALDKERVQTEINECDVRVNIVGEYYMIVEVKKENSKIMYLDGSFEWLDNYNIITDEKTEMTMEEFLEIVMKDK